MRMENFSFIIFSNCHLPHNSPKLIGFLNLNVFAIIIPKIQNLDIGNNFSVNFYSFVFKGIFTFV